MMCSYEHWIKGSYLITSVEREDGEPVTISMDTQAQLDALSNRLDEDLAFTIQGRKLRVAAQGALAGVGHNDLQEAFAALTAPVELVFEHVTQLTCGDDHVSAVNLTRPMDDPRAACQSVVDDAVATLQRHYAGAGDVRVVHYHGGPCHEDEVAMCLVLGGTGRGWTIVGEIGAAIRLACARAQQTDTENKIHAGQVVELAGLQARPDLNGEVGVALKFVEDAGRWLVRLADGDGKRVKPRNLTPSDPGTGTVYVFWGKAQWSRAQLLGEIAKGSWGLCRASVTDVTKSPGDRWEALRDRMAFAPVTEMSDDYIQQAQQQMDVFRAEAEQQQPAPTAESDDEEINPADD